ncbi:MAG: cysteine desulfurase family protein [Sedimentitalea sp.]
MNRVYLDHNATTPLRPEARMAMQTAMDVVGNPSSVHGEGRAAKALVERARAQVAELVGCLPTQVVFTGSASEAAALAVAQKGRHGAVFAALPTEHDCFLAWSETELKSLVASDGKTDPAGASAFLGWVTQLGGATWAVGHGDVALVAMSAANSETGVLQGAGVVPSGAATSSRAGTLPYAVVCDITQLAGKVPVVYPEGARPAYMILSAHKLGGPKGVGALINFTAEDTVAILRGGGQEMGRRSGTENVIGIAGFGAAAAAAQRDLANGIWDRVAELRNILEKALEAGANKTIFVGKSGQRLPNTSCFATPGWKGETQVMQMDLSGFAISAGSACSSGKVRASTVLRAMGFDDDVASSAVRVSLGHETTLDEVEAFAETWLDKEMKHRARAA